ncbi:MAG: hypothetical protein ABSA53_22740 [Streptosporangiaceae bacterium]|jgi:hypothetical protein
MGIAALAVGTVPGMASAAPTHSGGNYTCTGTTASPGTLAGHYANVTVTGTCLVDAGNVNIAGNLIIAQNASLAADFGQDDQTISGTSNLTVRGNLIVEKGGSALLGCYPLAVTLWFGPPPTLASTPDFPCDDDANPLTTPTLSATEYIGGNLIAYEPLGVVVHNTTVRGNVIQYGGGNGTAFDPVGIFAAYIPGGSPAAPGQIDPPAPLPAYTDFSNVKAGGNLIVTGMDTSWYGIIRDTVRGSLIDRNNTTAPDGNEMSDNTIHGNLICSGNNPAVEYGDSNGVPSEVGGIATGECGFNVLIPNPSPLSVSGLPSYPLDHVAVHLHR